MIHIFCFFNSLTLHPLLSLCRRIPSCGQRWCCHLSLFSLLRHFNLFLPSTPPPPPTASLCLPGRWPLLSSPLNTLSTLKYYPTHLLNNALVVSPVESLFIQRPVCCVCHTFSFSLNFFLFVHVFVHIFHHQITSSCSPAPGNMIVSVRYFIFPHFFFIAIYV